MGYSSLSTSRGAGNWFRDFDVFCRYSHLSTSRGAGNTRASCDGAVELCAIDTYQPREGPETQVRYQTALNSDSIDTYLPREGTETNTSYYEELTMLEYSHLSTSRGDGNHVFFLLRNYS